MPEHAFVTIEYPEDLEIKKQKAEAARQREAVELYRGMQKK